MALNFFFKPHSQPRLAFTGVTQSSLNVNRMQVSIMQSYDRNRKQTDIRQTLNLLQARTTWWCCRRTSRPRSQATSRSTRLPSSPGPDPAWWRRWTGSHWSGRRISWWTVRLLKTRACLGSTPSTWRSGRSSSSIVIRSVNIPLSSGHQ